MMKIFLIAGTEDGRKLAEILSEKNEVTASVVSDYGKKILEQYPKIKISEKKLNAAELEKILSDEFEILIDASHPYAENISKNAIEACENAKIKYIRYERAEVEINYKKIFIVENYEEAAKKSAELGKNIFLTTGSRNLKTFVESPFLKNCQVFARILPTAEVLLECEKMGLSPKQIIAMQGPFTTELNVEIFKHFGAEVIITKNSGKIGGADKKIAAAEILNLPVIIINRPKIKYPEVATTFEEIFLILQSVSH